MLSEHYKKHIATSAFEMVDKIKVLMDGGDYFILPIAHKELTGDYMKVIGNLEQQIVGKIMELQLLDAEGKVLMNRVHELSKTERSGMLIMFQIRILESEVL